MVLSSNGSIIDNPAATNSHCSSSSSVITDTTVASNSGDGGGGAVTGAPVPIGENDSNNTNLVAIPVATTTTVAAKPVAVGDSPPPPNHNINNTAATESSLFLATHKKLPLEMDAHSNTDTTTATASVSPPWQTKNTESFLVSASSRTVENDVNGENGHRGVVWNSISDSPVVHHRDLELGETATAVVAAADVYTKAPTLTGAAAPPTTDADVDADDTNSHSTASLFVLFHRKLVFTLFIVLVGMGAAAALLTLGIRAAQTEQSSRFDRAAEDFSNSLGACVRACVVCIYSSFLLYSCCSIPVCKCLLVGVVIHFHGNACMHALSHILCSTILDCSCCWF